MFHFYFLARLRVLRNFDNLFASRRQRLAVFLSSNLALPRDVHALLARACDILRAVAQTPLSYYRNAAQQRQDASLVLHLRRVAEPPLSNPPPEYSRGYDERVERTLWTLSRAITLLAAQFRALLESDHQEVGQPRG